MDSWSVIRSYYTPRKLLRFFVVAALFVILVTIKVSPTWQITLPLSWQHIVGILLLTFSSPFLIIHKQYLDEDEDEDDLA